MSYEEKYNELVKLINSYNDTLNNLDDIKFEGNKKYFKGQYYMTNIILDKVKQLEKN